MTTIFKICLTDQVASIHDTRA